MYYAHPKCVSAVLHLVLTEPHLSRTGAPLGEPGVYGPVSGCSPGLFPAAVASRPSPFLGEQRNHGSKLDTL